MEETTTTEAPVESGATIQGVPVDDQGQALPEKTEAAEAVTTTTESGADEALPEDDKLQKFAENHGLELDSPNARKAAKMAMDNQAEYQRTRQKTSELERTMTAKSDNEATQIAQATGQDPEYLKRLQRIEAKDAVRDFWDANPDAKQYEKEMAKIVIESGLYGSTESILKASYAMAAAQNLSGVKSEGGREALESLAHKQQASVPRGNAVNSASMETATITPQNVSRLVDSHDQAWFEKNYQAISKAMAG